MENEFVSYEQALILKELEYYENTLRVYSIRWKKLMDEEYAVRYDVDYVKAPLKQQLFKWFREKHNIIGLIEGGYTEGKNVFSYVIWRESDDDWTYDYYDDYEKVENMLIDKLIEVLKQKKDGERKN